MECRGVQARLDAFLDGTLAAAERAAVERHLAECPDCGAPDLVAGVLERTSGPACAGAHDRLPDFVDGTLDAESADLVAGHLFHCRECSNLAAALRALEVDLPALAESAVDLGFVADVLAATVGVEARRRRWLPWRDLAKILVARPRIAWEGAYVAAVIVALLFGIPGSPLGRVPQRALELARVNPVVEIRAPLEDVTEQVSAGAESLVGGSVQSARGAWLRVREDLGTFWHDLASRVGDDNEETKP